MLINKYTNHKFGDLIIELFFIVIAVTLGMKADEILDYKIQTSKAKTQEVFYLANIINDLEISLEDLDRDLKNHYFMLDETEKIMTYLSSGMNKLNTLNWDCLNSDFQFYPNISGYENLKNLGFDIITDDSLRLSIVDLFELDIKRIVGIGKENTNTKDIKEIMEPFIQRNFKLSHSFIDTIKFKESNNYSSTFIDRESKTYNVPMKIIPINVKALKCNTEFRYLLQKTCQIRQDKIKYYEGAKTRINLTQAEICRYLAERIRKYGINSSDLKLKIGSRTYNVCCKLEEINNESEVKKNFVSDGNSN